MAHNFDIMQNRESKSAKFGNLEPLQEEEDDKISLNMTEYGGIKRSEIERIEAKCAKQGTDMMDERIDTE